ncbi:L,D-transpeptidase [Phormidium yuhuli AB48]|uniref:L,D-transpeptidase n=1 Tax=Phormidium yuhuli AB48 TaxID=2940671 RepID=A0ABY5AUG0_9CYAN|nr:L,D-transpeptidase [Phormidium yuhuli]USR92877.1 L,D-transpeptidase [Phormidium yuhuli AB48]
MYNNQSITQIFSLLCFLGAVTLVVLDVLVPDESRSSRNPQGAEPAGSSPSLLSLLDIPVTTGLNTLGGFRPPVTAPASSGERSSDTVRLVVSLSQRQVALYRGDSRKAEYPVAIGQTGWETPTGAFEVIETQKYPTWEHPLTGERIPPGPRNPLGDRWIGFWTDGRVYVGFHGTADESSIGVAASHGCLRLSNTHIRELFEQVEPGTPVMVQP